MWSAVPGSLSWIEICTWSSPASESLRERLLGDADRRGDQIGVEAGVMRGLGDLDEIAPRAPARRPTDAPAARRAPRLRLNTRAQVAVSSSSARPSSASGLEQYGQPSGQRCVSSASRPSGRGARCALRPSDFDQSCSSPSSMASRRLIPRSAFLVSASSMSRRARGAGDDRLISSNSLLSAKPRSIAVTSARCARAAR